jgi:hypothetical protein
VVVVAAAVGVFSACGVEFFPATHPELCAHRPHRTPASAVNTTQGQPGGLHWPSVAESAALLRVVVLADWLGVLHDYVNASYGVCGGWSNRRGTPRELVSRLRDAQECLLVFIGAVGHSWRGEPVMSAVVSCGGGADDTGPVVATIVAPWPPDVMSGELSRIYHQLDPHRPSTGLEPLWMYLKRGPFEQTGVPLVEGGAPTFVASPLPLPLASNALSLALGYLHEGVMIAERAAPRGVTVRRARRSLLLPKG